MELKIIFIYLKIIYFYLKLISYIIIENEMLMYFLIFLKVFKYFIFLISDQNGGEYDVVVIGGGIVGMVIVREMKV